MKKLTDKQELFCQCYVFSAETGKSFNATQAYIDAGYGDRKHANKRSYLMMKNEVIRARIDELMDEKKRQFNLDESDILEGLYKEAMGLQGDSTQSGRIAAWAWLGKHLRMFQEQKHEALGNTQFNIISYTSEANKPVEKIIKAAEALPAEEVRQIENNMDSVIEVTEYGVEEKEDE